MNPAAMITRSVARATRVSTTIKIPGPILMRQFSVSKEHKTKNRIFTPVRRPDDFQTYLLLSTSSRTPLLTFWTASYCNTCSAVSPVLQGLIEDGVGELEGGVSFCEIEYDCPDIMQSGLGMTYMITSMPTLLSFDRGEPQNGTKVTDPHKMKDRQWLKEWIRTEARRGGNGGDGGGTVGKGLFRGLWGNSDR